MERRSRANLYPCATSVWRGRVELIGHCTNKCRPLWQVGVLASQLLLCGVRQ